MIQVSGPALAVGVLAVGVLAELVDQVALTGLPSRLWGVAPARVGPCLDLVASGSGLRLHAVIDGALVRTHEILTFQHGRTAPQRCCRPPRPTSGWPGRRTR